MHKKNYYAVSDISWLQPFLYNKMCALTIHWVFQGIVAMDRTERFFKLAIDTVLTFLFYLVLIQRFSFIAAITLGWGLAHTVNFIFNGQAFVVLKNFGSITHQADEYEQYISSMKIRMGFEPGIKWVAIYGSLSRGELKATSDLDVRVIRYPGFINGLRTCLFVLRERTIAHLKQYPIDILLLDSPRLLKRLRPDEPPIVIYDASGKLNKSHDNYK